MKEKILIITSIFLLSSITILSLLYHQQSNLSIPKPALLKTTSLHTPQTLKSPTSTLPNKLSLEAIFNPSQNRLLNQLPQEETITLITTGDVIPARTVNYKMTTYNDFTHPFLETEVFLKKADLTLINLESPLIKNCPVTNSGMIFCGNQKFIKGLEHANIDVINLANNHTLNYGLNGIFQTCKLLFQKGIAFTGVNQNCYHQEKSCQNNNQLLIKTVKGKKLGFTGYNLLEKINEAKIFKQTKEASKKVDFLIVSVHWGTEYSSFPTSRQTAFAHKLINANASLIVGNHPHWIQPIEIYKNKVILYAHGNFIFDQEWSTETKTGIVVKTYIYQNKIAGLQFSPVFISDYNQPELLKGEKKAQVLKKFINNSFLLEKNQSKNN